MAQLVEHSAVMREGVSSTPARPTLKFLKCCLCNYIWKCLDFQVFSDNDYKPLYGRAFCVSPLQIATADTDTMAAIEICGKREDIRVYPKFIATLRL